MVVADIGMAPRDGYELIRRLRKLDSSRGGNVPAIAVTAYASPEDRTRTLAAGYQLHISKPIDATGLVAAVRSVGRCVDA